MTLPGGQQFSCRIELSQSDGVTIIICDSKQKENLQKKIVLGPTSLIVTCKNGQQTSTITQTETSLKLEVSNEKSKSTVDQDAENITMTCKNLTVDAETVLLKASKDGTFQTQGACYLKSTQDMSLESSAAFSVKSTGELAAQSQQSVALKATTALSMQGAQAELKGQTQLGLESSGKTSLSGVTVAVNGQTQAVFEAPVTSVGKNVTTVKGQMVEVSGALVKLG